MLREQQEYLMNSNNSKSTERAPHQIPKIQCKHLCGYLSFSLITRSKLKRILIKNHNEYISQRNQNCLQKIAYIISTPKYIQICKKLAQDECTERYAM